MTRSRRSEPLFEVNYWPAVTDLIASFLLLFVFFTFYQFFARFEVWENLVIKSKQGQLEAAFWREFPKEMEERAIRISVNGNLQRITYSNKLLFDSGSVELRDSSYLRASAEIFKRIGEEIFSAIQVEGFTDSWPVKQGSVLRQRGISDNWDLSTKRAVEVVRNLHEEIGIDPRLLSATGYSWYQSLYNQTETQRARNRKIEIVLIYSTHESTR